MIYVAAYIFVWWLPGVVANLWCEGSMNRGLKRVFPSSAYRITNAFVVRSIVCALFFGPAMAIAGTICAIHFELKNRFKLGDWWDCPFFGETKNDPS